MRKRETLEQEPSTGNVFADLGLPGAGEHLIKAGLVVRMDRTIRQRKLTQAAAAQLMGIDQPKISAILAGPVPGIFGRAPHAFPGRVGARCRDRRKA
jgi:predicted XRE-type DNA-binding protein